MIRRNSAAATLALTVALAACAGPDGQGTDAAATPTTYASDVLVDTEWILANAADSSVRLVEVGSGAEAYAESRIPGAVFLSIGSLSNPDDPIRGQIATRSQVSSALSAVGVRADETVVLYDRNNNLQAARAYWVLSYYRHPSVRLYDGGAARWTRDGASLSAEPAAETEPSTYEAGPADPEIRTTWEYVVEHTDDPSTLMCDVRSADEYAGIDVRSERGGHIPGALNVEWDSAIDDQGLFKPADELFRLYTAAGFTPDRQIITYCQSGVRGAHTWFVLKELLGYPSVRNYDGSWNEYGNNPESPIES